METLLYKSNICSNCCSLVMAYPACESFAMSSLGYLWLYKIADEFEGVNATLATQAVYNATQTAAINCMQGQISQLFGLTKLVVPNTSVCPGWGNVTITPNTTTAG